MTYDSDYPPKLCFTCDLDWAPEFMIEETVRLFKEYKVPLTPFITHPSDMIKKNYRGSKACYVGLHPNFLPGSTHGDSFASVIDHVTKLWPKARSFRSHNYFDNLVISQMFYEKRIQYDSNLCLYLQNGIQPLIGVTGLIRFPVFLEDILFIDKFGTEEFMAFNSLESSGIKIFNFHPVHIYLNTPDVESYLKAKRDVYAGRNCEEYINKGKGIRTLLEAILQFLKDRYRTFYYLDDLYMDWVSQNSFDRKPLSEFFMMRSSLDQPDTHVSVWAEKGKLREYCSADPNRKGEILREVMNLTDGRNIYATSPDFNFRELEIDFIIRGLKRLEGKGIPKILDIGCGNGYTDLRIAQSMEADITGIDFSKSMIDGANYLKERFEGLKSHPTFKIGDATNLAYEGYYYDAIISERLLLNLPDRVIQFRVIRDIRRLLRNKGLFIMVEGSEDGLRNLNDLRRRVGLEEISDVSNTNVSSLKFKEGELQILLDQAFWIVEKQHFGMYYLISRVVHPLLVQPENPRYDARINEVARKIASIIPDLSYGVGHVVGYILEAK